MLFPRTHLAALPLLCLLLTLPACGGHRREPAGLAAARAAAVPNAVPLDDDALRLPSVPVLGAVHPPNAFEVGGAVVALDGEGLAPRGLPVPEVLVGGALATALPGGEPGLRAVLPAGAPGAASVTVASRRGITTLPGGLTYFQVPTAMAGSDLRISMNPAGLGLRSATLPEVARSGKEVYVAWRDARNGLPDIYFTVSRDQGRTWLLQDIRLDTDLPGSAASSLPAIAATGDRVYVAWLDQRDPTETIRFNRSLDRGATWLADDVRLDAVAGPGNARQPRIACAGASVYIVWEDRRSGGADIHANVSHDAGSTWQGGFRLDSDPAGLADSLRPRIRAHGDRVFVVWQDLRAPAGIYFNRSVNRGEDWLPAEVALNTGSLGAAAPTLPRLSCDGDRVYAVWLESRTTSTNRDVYCNASADAGTTWLATDVKVSAGIPSLANTDFPALCCSGSTVHVAWADRRYGGTDVFYRRSRDGGATWEGELRLETDPRGQSSAFDVDIACHDQAVFVVWSDGRSGKRDVYLRASATGGAAWNGGEHRVNTDPEGADFSQRPRVVAHGARAIVVWEDRRGGAQYEIYASRNEP